MNNDHDLTDPAFNLTQTDTPPRRKPMSEHACYWAFTGRIPFDDEDTPFIILEPCIRADAANSFRTWMINTALETESMEHLANRVEAPEGAQLSDYVYITSVFRSNSPIYHCF